MSKQVDERVVEMQFDNKQFEQGIAQSLKTLEKMEKALDQMGASSKGVSTLADNLNKMDFSVLSSNVDKIANRFTLLGNLADQLRTRISNSILNFGKTALTTVTGLTKTGGINRALNIESAQFQLEGLDVEWNKISDDINYGVKSTAYGLDAAAKAASQLVASGVEFGDTFGDTGNSPMAKALRGISGVAAMTNSSYEEISRIFTTVAGNGRLMSMQLLQLSSRGLNVAATLGESLGKSEAEIRDMVSKGQISFSMFAEAMDDAFGAHAKDANKTFTGAMSNVKAALSRIGAAVASSSIVDLRDIFNQLIPLIDNAKTLLMPMIERINSTIHKIALNIEDALFYIGHTKGNDTLKNLVTTFDNLGKAAASIIKPVLAALGVFSSGNIYADINGISKALAKLSAKLILPEKKGKKLTSTLKLLFKVIKSIAAGIAAVIKVISPLFKLVTGFVDGIFTFFDTISRRFDTEIAGKMHTDKVVDKIDSARSVVEKFVDFILKVTSKVPEKLAGIVIFVAKMVAGIKENVSKLKGNEFAKGVGKVVSTIMKHLQTLAAFLVDIGLPAIIAGIGAAIKWIVNLLRKIPWSSIIDNLKSVFGWLKDHLDALISLVTKGKFTSISDILTTLGNNLNDFFSGLNNTSDGMIKLSGAIDDTDKSVGNLFNRFTGIKTGIGNFIDKLLEATNITNKFDHAMYVTGLVSKDTKAIIDKAAFGKIADNLVKMAENARSLLESLYTSLGVPDAGSIMGLALGGGAFYVLINFGRLLHSLAELGKNLAGGFGIKKFLDTVGEGIAYNQKSLGNAALVKSFSISIALLSASIIALAITANKYDIVTPAKIVGQFLIAIAASLATLMIVGKICKTNWNTLVALSAFSIALGATMLLMSKAISNVMSIPWNKLDKKTLIAGAVALVGMLVALLVGLRFASSKMGSRSANIGAIMDMVAIVLSVGILIKVMKKVTQEDIEKLKNGWKAIAGLILTVTASLWVISMAGKSMALAGIGIFALAAAVLPVIAAIALLTAMGQNDKYIYGLIDFVALIAMLGALMKAMDMIIKKSNPADIGKGFLGIGAAMVLIAVSMGIMTKVIEDHRDDPGVIVASFLIIAGLIAEFLLLGKMINQGGTHAAQFAKTFAGIGAAIILISLGIAILSVLDTKKMVIAAAVVAGILGMFALIINNIKGAQKAMAEVKPGKVLALTTLFSAVVGAFVVIGAGIAILAKNFGAGATIAIVAGSIAAVGGLLLAMAGAAKIASGITDKINWKGLLTLALTYGILAGAIIAVAKIGGTNVIDSALGLSAVLIALAGVTKLVDKVVSKEAIASILLLSTACIAISAAMLILGMTDFNNSAKNAIVLVGIIALLTVISNFAQGAVAGAGAITLLSLSCISIAVALKMLSDVPFDKMVTAIIGLGLSLLALAAAGYVATGAVPGLLGVAGAVLILAATPLVLATGLYVASKAVDAFADTLVNLGMRAPAIIASIEAIAEGVKYVCLNAMAEILEQIPVIGDGLAEGARESAEKAKVAMKEASNEAKAEEMGYQMVKRVSDGTKQAQPEMENAGSDLFGSLKEGLMGGTNLSDISSIGSNLVGKDGLLGGVTSGFEDLKATGETGMEDFVGLLDQSETAKQNGGYTLQGFIDGTPDQSFFDQGLSNAEAYNEGFTSFTKIESPSKLMTQNGKFLIEGLIIGLESGDSTVIKTGEQVAANVSGALSNITSSEAESAGKNVVIGFNNGLANREINNRIIANARSIANNVLSILRSAFKIHSPSKVTEQYGEYVGQGFENGIVTSFKKASATFATKLQWFKEITNDTVRAVASDMEVGGDTLLVLSERFGSWIDNLVDPMSSLNAARTTITRFIDANYRQTDSYKQHIKTIKEYEKQIDELSVDMEANAEKISDAFDGIKEEAQSMAKEAADSFNSLRDNIKSTLTDSVKLLNQSLESGLQLMSGFEIQAKTVISAAMSSLSTYASRKSKSVYDNLDIFSGFTRNRKKKSQVQVLFDYINKQIDDVENRSKNIQKLGTMGISTEVKQAIENMGADADEMIDAMLDMTTDEIQNINALYNKQLTLTKKDEKTIIQDIFSTITSEIDTVKKHTADMATLAQKGLTKEFLQELNDMGEDGYEMIRGFLAMNEEQIQKFNELYKEQQKLNEESSETAVEAAIRTMRENIEKFYKVNANYQKALGKGVNKEFLDSINDGTDEGYKLIAGFAEASGEEIATANSYWAKQQEYANQALNRNLQETVDDMNSFADLITEAAKRGIPEGMIAEIAKAGPSAKGYLTALLSMTTEELNNFINLWTNAQNTAINTTDAAISAMAIAGANAGGAFADSIAEYDITARSEEISSNYISFINGMGVEMNNAAWTVGREVTLNLAKGLLAEDAQAELESAGAASAGSYGKGIGGMSDYASEEMEETNNAVVAGTKNLIDYINEAGLNIDTITLPEVARIITKRLVGVHGEINQQLYNDLQENYNMSDEMLTQWVNMIQNDKAGDAYNACLTYMGSAGNGAIAAHFPQKMKDEGDKATTGFCNNMENVNAPHIKRAANTAMEAGNDGIFEADMPGATKGEVDDSLTEFNKISSPENVRKNKQGGFDATDAINKGADEAKVPEKIAGIITSISTSVATGLTLIGQLNTAVAAAGLIAGDMGSQVGDNLADGMTSVANKQNTDKITKAGRQAGDTAVTAVRSACRVSSPSKITTWVGTMIGAGLEVGMKKSEKGVRKEGENLGAESLVAFQNAVKQSALLSDTISNIPDASPTLTPILDLDYLTRQAKEINSILNIGNSMTVELSANIDGSLQRAQNVTAQMNESLRRFQAESMNQTNMLESQLNRLRGEISNVTSAMSNMRVMLDSGELVGAMSQNIDKSLGRMVNYAERGM